MRSKLSVPSALVVAVLLSGCGGGGPTVAGIEGSGITNPNPAPTPTPTVGGIVSNAVISGLGSIFVQGVEYALDESAITIDGSPGTAADLVVGQVVTLTATTGSVAAHANAVSVTYDTDIEGAIDAVSSDGSRITILGQIVDLDAQENWRVGNTVAVSGFRNAQSVWLATRVTATASTRLVVSGLVQQVNSSAKTFAIGALTVSYEAATLKNISADPVDGANVRVTSRTPQVGGVLQADTLTGLDPALPGTSGDSAYLEGWITALVSAQEFDVNNHHVVTSTSTSYWPNPVASISTSSFVRVSGLRRVDGGVDALGVTTCNLSPVTGHSATLMHTGKVLLLGGDPCGEFAEIFDPANNSFASAGRTATSRFLPLVTLLPDGRVLIAGGWGDQYTTFADGSTSGWADLTSTEIYDPASGRFTASGNMASGHVRGTATLLPDGRVLIAGGIKSREGGGAASNSAEVFDPHTEKFTPVGAMASRADHTANLLGNGTILMAGGWNGHAADAPDDPPYDPLVASLFDPASSTFRAAASMSTTRMHHHAISLSGDTVLLFGGIPTPLQNAHEQPPDPAYAEMYHASTNIFARFPMAPLAQTGYTVTLLKNGQVLILGGEIDNLAVTTAQLLDPAIGNVSPTTNLVSPRAGHTATLLSDGRVLVIGGNDASGNTAASFEYWTGSP